MDCANNTDSIVLQRMARSWHWPFSTVWRSVHYREFFISFGSPVNTMNNPTSTGSLISLQVGDANSTGYKSIQKVIWDDIPSFAVLTGPNGAGKTQLLQILAYKLSQTQYDQAPTLSAMPIKVSGDTIGPHEIAYLPSVEYTFGVQGSSIGGLQQQKQ